MAEMYKRFAEGYDYQSTEDGISGQEIYIRDDTNGTVAVASLPVVGTSTHVDPYGSTVGSCYCRTKKASFIDGDPNTLRWTFTFNTKKPSAEANPINNDPNARRFRMGAEIATIKDASNSGYYWNSGGSTDLISNQQLWYRIVTGEFTIPKSNLTSAQNANFIGSIQAYAGRVNSASFENFAVGQVYFAGVDGGTTYDNGNLRWNYEMHFQYQINPNTGQSSNDMLYIPREDGTGGWDIPKDKNGNFMFGFIDLNNIK